MFETEFSFCLLSRLLIHVFNFGLTCVRVRVRVNVCVCLYVHLVHVCAYVTFCTMCYCFSEHARFSYHKHAAGGFAHFPQTFIKKCTNSRGLDVDWWCRLMMCIRMRRMHILDLRMLQSPEKYAGVYACECWQSVEAVVSAVRWRQCLCDIWTFKKKEIHHDPDRVHLGIYPYMQRAPRLPPDQVADVSLAGWIKTAWAWTLVRMTSRLKHQYRSGNFVATTVTARVTVMEDY
jgi:hypothetical protein